MDAFETVQELKRRNYRYAIFHADNYTMLRLLNELVARIQKLETALTATKQTKQ